MSLYLDVCACVHWRACTYMLIGIGRLVLWFGCHWSPRIHVKMPGLRVLLLLVGEVLGPWRGGHRWRLLGHWGHLLPLGGRKVVFLGPGSSLPEYLIVNNMESGPLIVFGLICHDVTSPYMCLPKYHHYKTPRKRQQRTATSYYTFRFLSYEPNKPPFFIHYLVSGILLRQG